MLTGAALLVVWMVAGCGGGNEAPRGDVTESQGYAPIETSAAGTADVIIGFKQAPGRSEERLVEGQGGRISYTYHIIPAIAATIPQKAVAALERWRKHYNTMRPHSSLGYRPPAPEAHQPWAPGFATLSPPPRAAWTGQSTA